jgi:hypothetical protein
MVTPVAAARARSVLGRALAAMLILSPLQAAAGAEDGGRAPPAALRSGLLSVVAVMPGMRLAVQSDPIGTPRISGRLQFQNFVFPGALAVRWPDLYVVDTGVRAVYKVDLALQAMTAVPGLPVHPGTRIQIARDQSLYVLDPVQGTILRLARGGTRLPAVQAGRDLSRPTEFVLDERQSRIFAVDGLTQQVLEFHGAGRAYDVRASISASDGKLTSVGAVAATADALYVVDPACHCVARLDRDGKDIRSFGHDDLRLPGAIAVDGHERVFVADAFDHSLKVFRAGRLVASVAAISLGLGRFTAIAIDQSQLYVADGPGARVAVLRIAPPKPGED